MSAEFTSLYKLFEAIPDEIAAINHFKAIRWQNGEFCPYCGHDKVYGFETGKMAGRQWKCAQCREKFSIRVGTIFEDSKIPLRKWLAAIWTITAHSKGMSSVQLAKDIDVTQKTAWFMLHRLRHAARTRSFNRPLKGTVEVDDSHFGGKERNKHQHKRGKAKKIVAVGMLERGGELRVIQLTDGLGDMANKIVQNVHRGATLMTDEWSGFKQLDGTYARKSVNHSAGQYAIDDEIHTNSIEGMWSQMKRKIYGIHHWISRKHFQRYMDEVMWRYNRRDVPLALRFNEFIGRADGRLTYTALIAKA
jgi:transposase-like protein